MRFRHAVAPLWLAGRRVVTGLLPGVPGGFRIVLIHDIAKQDRAAFLRLVDRVVAAHGTITPEGAEARLAGAAVDSVPPGRAPCLFSFDDGFHSNLWAAEILAEREIRAQFFICPGLVDLSGEHQRRAIAGNVFRGRITPQSLPPDQRLMDWDEIARVRDLGHSIGAHGLSHRRLSDLEGGDLEDEIGRARERLESVLGATVPWFAFAFGTIGSLDTRALTIIARHFRYCRSGVRGINGAGTHRLAVCADSIDLSAPSAFCELVLEGGLDVRYRGARHALDGLVAKH